MSKYTTEVRYVCEVVCGYDESQGGMKVKDILAESWPKIFDFDFPIFDEEYRSVLCQKILKHYYTREIGFETVGLWKLKLDTKLNEIMPYYNDMYLSAQMKYDPLRDADYYREHVGSDESNTDSTGTTNRSGSGNDSNSSTDYRLYSDTPQGALTGVDRENYLTNATKNTHSGNGSNSYNEDTDNVNNVAFNSTDEYTDHIYGKFPGRSYASIIKEYREALINVDMMVINELSDLFMKLW